MNPMTDELDNLRVMHLVDHTMPYQSGYSIRGETIFESQKLAGLDPVVVSQHLRGNRRDNIVSKTNYHYMRNKGIDYYFYRMGTSMFDKFVHALVKLGDRGLKGTYFVAIKLDHMSRGGYVHNLCNMVIPDLIHAHTGAGHYARSLSREAKLPWVCELRGFLEDSFAAEGAYSEQGKLYKSSR